MIKDGDSNALGILQADFPAIRNILDKKHYIKNVPNHVKAAVKAKKAPALKGRHNQIQHQINRILGVVHRYEDRDISWRKQLFCHLGMQMVAHLCGSHAFCASAEPKTFSASSSSASSSQSTSPPSSATGSSSSSTAAVPENSEDYAGWTLFCGEWIGLNWHCRVETNEDGSSQNLLQQGQAKSQKWKFKVITCTETREWLTSYVSQQVNQRRFFVVNGTLPFC